MEKIINAYFYIAVFSTVLFLIKLSLFAFFGGDAEVETDFNDTIETDTSFNFLSIQSILAFLMGFGWIGLACAQEWKLDIKYTVLISAIFGFAMMYFSAWLMFCIKKLSHRVKVDYSKAVGLTCKTYTRFAPKSKGQIELDFNDKLSIEEAENVTEQEIPSFTPVKIVKYENNVFYITQE